MSTSSQGRPPTYRDDTKVCLCAKRARTRLQENSERRAVINLLVNNKGALTLEEIDAHFGFDIRETVMTLVRLGWLEVVG
jgi:hypothetical protein